MRGKKLISFDVPDRGPPESCDAWWKAIRALKGNDKQPWTVEDESGQAARGRRAEIRTSVACGRRRCNGSRSLMPSPSSRRFAVCAPPAPRYRNAARSHVAASRPPLFLCFALSSPAQFYVHRFRFSDLWGNQVRKGNALQVPPRPFLVPARVPVAARDQVGRQPAGLPEEDSVRISARTHRPTPMHRMEGLSTTPQAKLSPSLHRAMRFSSGTMTRMELLMGGFL
jgi:hypothetical protein